MPAGDPAGYLPSVKRARAKRGERIYQPRAKRGAKPISTPSAPGTQLPVKKQLPANRLGPLPPEKASSPAMDKLAKRIRAARGSSAAGQGLKGAALVRTRTRPAGPNAEIEAQAGAGNTERQYARGRRRWNVFRDSAGKRHVNSFLVSDKRKLH